MPSLPVIVASAVILATAVAHAAVPAFTVQEMPQVVLPQNTKVPVLLGVMSQCPDAIYCEDVFNDVLTRTLDKIDLSLTFIGKCVHSIQVLTNNYQQVTNTQNQRLGTGVWCNM